ncbi:MAG TPA: ChbG/HpnK family deacetylase [Terriglobales bacterium]|nr:ChbG/HpnK family deacetylase [Terriglobales bacterium]
MPEAVLRASVEDQPQALPAIAVPTAVAVRPTPLLVITADDLGLRPDWDEHVLQALREGVVTTASLVTNGETYPDNAATWRELGFDCGVHLNLTHGRPISPAAEIPSLVDEHGNFPGGIGTLLVRYARGQVRLAEVALEWERQLGRAIEDGFAPSHLNGHYHVHALPGLFAVAVRLAQRCGIQWVRLPEELPVYAGDVLSGMRSAALSLLARLHRQQHRSEIRLLPCRGIGRSGQLDLAGWRQLLDRVQSERDSVVEILCHPGQSAGEIAALGSAELRQRLQPLRLRSPRQLNVRART